MAHDDRGSGMAGARFIDPKILARIGNLRQAFNIREGINSLQFKVPGRVIGSPPLTAGPTAGFTLDEKTVDREFLTEMDWDLETTKPSRSKLCELGLEDVAQQLGNE